MKTQNVTFVCENESISDVHELCNQLRRAIEQTVRSQAIEYLRESTTCVFAETQRRDTSTPISNSTSSTPPQVSSTPSQVSSTPPHVSSTPPPLSSTPPPLSSTPSSPVSSPTNSSDFDFSEFPSSDVNLTIGDHGYRKTEEQKVNIRL